MSTMSYLHQQLLDMGLDPEQIQIESVDTDAIELSINEEGALPCYFCIVEEFNSGVTRILNK